MNNDWRGIACVLLFATIPTIGIWHCVHHLKIMNHEQHLKASELPVRVTDELQHLKLDGFAVVEEHNIATHGPREYACVESTGQYGQWPVTIILRRKIDSKSSLMREISTGAVNGLASTGQTISKKRAGDLGLVVPEYASNHLLVVDVDREYISSIIGVTIGFSIVGLIAITYLRSELDERIFKDRQSRNYVKAQHALQLKISQQELNQTGC